MQNTEHRRIATADGGQFSHHGSSEMYISLQQERRSQTLSSTDEVGLDAKMHQRDEGSQFSRLVSTKASLRVNRKQSKKKQTRFRYVVLHQKDAQVLCCVEFYNDSVILRMSSGEFVN